MGKGSRGKKFFDIHRTKRVKRLKERYGEQWNQPPPNIVQPYNIAGDTEIFQNDYITPENTKTKRGRIPHTVKEADIPSYLLSYCNNQAKDGKDSDYCINECPLGEDCEGSPGDIHYPMTHTVKGFKAVYPDREVKMPTIGLTV
ncbi:MAG: hypothetical protein GTN76_14120 [Candidatus Aenigmarchaeota archaeon]|nr:hypothetical protein [Candidatus Aenigmarchaeota archaeon]